MDEPVRPEARYAAFLSYSHRDAATAGRLHRRLESYRLPRRLAGTQGMRGMVPARLWPIFRDREELPAAADLSETVRDALAQSEALIVLCSPDAAASLWVAEEIGTFRAMHPDRPILAAILGGDPPDCFPAGLRVRDRDSSWHEPLATDLRPGRDGAHLGLLKLVAGITGVGLDDLVQRDAARKIRRVMAVTGAALIALLITAALALVAVNARGEAERQRAEAERWRATAEGQIEFMLTDLRNKLRGVGRLDIMTAVDRNALRYYGGQRELARLPADALVRRARVLLATGEDELDRHQYGEALTAFREAHRTTAEQLARAPGNPDRIFAHSQSEFYVGRVSYERRNFAAARRAWERYRALTDRLLTINPRNPDWLKEAAFAEGSVCAAIADAGNDIPAALRSCTAALARMEEAARVSGNIAEFRSNLANRHAYVGDALKAAGRSREALVHQQRRLAYVERQLADDPANAQLRARRLWALRAIALLEADLGQATAAVARMAEVLQGVEALVRLDPTNGEWSEELPQIRADLIRMRQTRRR